MICRLAQVGLLVPLLARAARPEQPSAPQPSSASAWRHASGPQSPSGANVSAAVPGRRASEGSRSSHETMPRTSAPLALLSSAVPDGAASAGKHGSRRELAQGGASLLQRGRRRWRATHLGRAVSTPVDPEDAKKELIYGMPLWVWAGLIDSAAMLCWCLCVPIILTCAKAKRREWHG